MAHAVPPWWDAGGQSRLCFHGVPQPHNDNGWKTFPHLRLPQQGVVPSQQEALFLQGLLEDNFTTPAQRGTLRPERCCPGELGPSGAGPIQASRIIFPLLLFSERHMPMLSPKAVHHQRQPSVSLTARAAAVRPWSMRLGYRHGGNCNTSLTGGHPDPFHGKDLAGPAKPCTLFARPEEADGTGPGQGPR